MDTAKVVDHIVQGDRKSVVFDILAMILLDLGRSVVALDMPNRNLCWLAMRGIPNCMQRRTEALPASSPNWNFP
jgi:hypothetical protein